MPKILISDAMDNIASEILKKNQLEVDTITSLEPNDLKKIILNYDGLIVRSATKVKNDIIESAKNLKIIGRAGAGVDNIDLESAKKNNIIVMNTPGGNSNATAEHTIGLIFSLLRKIPFANYSTHKGLWEKKKFKGNELRGKNIGIIGFGNVGKKVAEISNAIGMNVHIHSSYFDKIKQDYKSFNSCSLNKILSNSDIVTFHCKPNKNGSSIVTKEEIKLMKKNCILINTSRGDLINEIDLVYALKNNLIRGAALDVFKNEPAKDSVLFGLDNIILTPHIAASTDEAQIIVAEMIANQFCDFFKNKKITNSVI